MNWTHLQFFLTCASCYFVHRPAAGTVLSTSSSLLTMKPCWPLHYSYTCTSNNKTMLKCVIVWLLIGILISCCYDNSVFKYITTVYGWVRVSVWVCKGVCEWVCVREWVNVCVREWVSEWVCVCKGVCEWAWVCVCKGVSECAKAQWARVSV